MEIEADMQPLAIATDIASSSSPGNEADTDADEATDATEDDTDAEYISSVSSSSSYSGDSSSWASPSDPTTSTSAYTYKPKEPRDPNNPTNKEDLRRNKWKKINSKYDKKMTPVVSPIGVNGANDNYFWSGEDEYLSDPSAMVNNGGGSHSISKKQQVSTAA